jgi:predicted transcriptional regulator
VHELLIRGYSQYEISNTLHLSQPTISRDIHYIRNQNSSAVKRKNLAYRYYYEQQNCLDGVQELMKKLWLIIDNPKIEVKERMKAMALIMQCYYMRSKLIDSEAFNKEFLDYTKKVQNDEESLRIREEEVARKEESLEKALDDHLKNKNLKQEEIDEIRDRGPVF